MKKKPRLDFEFVNIAYKYPPQDPLYIREHVFCCPQLLEEAIARKVDSYAEANARFLRSLDDLFVDDGSWD